MLSSNVRHSVAHGMMLTDQRRIDAYRWAIEATVRPGDVVVDLGAGSGILSLLAARAGARKVYAIERGTVARLAKAIVAGSPFADRIEVIESPVETAVLPERADLAVTETVGHIAIDEGIAEILDTARERFLKPGGSEIPHELWLSAAPVRLPRSLLRAVELREVVGFDLGLVGDAVANGLLRVKHEDLSPDASLGPPREIWRQPAVMSGCLGAHRARLPIERAGHVSGLALLLGIELVDDVTLELELGQPSHWACPVLPLRPALDVLANDVLEATVVLGGREARGWHVRQLRGGRVVTDRHHAPDNEAALFGVGDTAAKAPQNGVYRDFARAVLDLVDGTRTCTEIAARLDRAAIPVEARDRPTDAVLDLLERLRLIRLQ